MTPLEPARLVREVRRRAGVDQRELARRAGTAQSVVARIEAGDTRPRSDTLARLVEAGGFDLDVELVPWGAPDSHMLDDVERILRLTPEERLLEVANVNRFVHRARRI